MARRRTSWRRYSGVTLIEVLAALALLGSLAVAMVLSRGRLVEQDQRARQKLNAVALADAMLADWWAGDARAIPVGESGKVTEHPGWVWETEEIPNTSLQPFDARVVRLRVLNESDAGQPIELTSVDLVLPSEGAP